MVRAAPTFCAACGYRLTGRAPDVQRGALLSIVISVLGAYAALIAAGALAPEDGTVTGELIAGLLWLAALGGVLFLALLPLGLRDWRRCFPLALDLRGALLGLAASAAALAASAIYLLTLQALAGEAQTEPDLTEPTPFVAALFTWVLFPAVVEELADRGVLWEALRRITGVGGTILGTALVFAFLHGLGEGAFLEIPHRFAMGLVFGWLRARTGSLAPCMIAHGANNLVALWLDAA